MTTILENDALSFGFSSAASLVSLKYAGREFLASDSLPELFTLFLRRRGGGKAQPVRSTDFADIRVLLEEDGGVRGLVLLFRACRDVPGLEARARIRLDGATAFSRWSLDVCRLPASLYCDSFLFPQMELANTLRGVGGDGGFFWPGMEGTVFHELETRQRSGGFASALLEYPLNGVGPYYPGPVPMQFEAYTTGHGSLYFGCHDTSHAPKGIDVAPGASGNIRPVWQFFPGATGGAFSSPGEFVLGGFEGDWQDACVIYRDWMERHDRTLPPKTIHNPDLPAWVKDSPVLLAYPVKGSGLDLGSLEGNAYFPYDNGLEVCRRYHRLWDTSVMALLMHWEGTAPWAPPYVWPPYGGERMLSDFARRLHEQGDLLGVYCSGTAWTNTSSIDPSYSREQEFAERHLEREMCVGPEGEMYAKVCNGPPGQGQRIGFDSCVARPWTVRTVTEEIRKCVSDSGIDYLQYFDQNQGGSAPLCYAEGHGHPCAPGPWLTEAMSALLDQAAGALDGVSPRPVIGCENAAAHPYIRNLQLNDLRNHLTWLYSVPVPAYSMVFHEYINNFTGNGVCLASWIDRARSPWFLLHRLAYSFVSGEMLSVVLKDGGAIHWSWVCRWDEEPPEQPPLQRLIGAMTAWRRHRARDFLVFGRMEKNVGVACRSRTLFFTVGRAPVELPVVLASRWRFQGREAVVLVNAGDRGEDVLVSFDEPRVGVCRRDPERDGEDETFRGREVALSLAPCQIVMLELS